MGCCESRDPLTDYKKLNNYNPGLIFEEETKEAVEFLRMERLSEAQQMKTKSVFSSQKTSKAGVPDSGNKVVIREMNRHLEDSLPRKEQDSEKLVQVQRTPKEQSSDLIAQGKFQKSSTFKSQQKGQNSSTTNENKKDEGQHPSGSQSRNESSQIIQMGREFSSIIEEEMISPRPLESDANYFDQGGATFGNEQSSFFNNRASKPDEFDGELADLQLEGTSKL